MPPGARAVRSDLDGLPLNALYLPIYSSALVLLLIYTYILIYPFVVHLTMQVPRNGFVFPLVFMRL